MHSYAFPNVFGLNCILTFGIRAIFENIYVLLCFTSNWNFGFLILVVFYAYGYFKFFQYLFFSDSVYLKLKTMKKIIPTYHGYWFASLINFLFKMMFLLQIKAMNHSEIELGEFWLKERGIPSLE